MLWWAKKEYQALKDIARHDGHGWHTFLELARLRRTKVAPHLYARVVNNIPWDATQMPPAAIGQWVATKEDDGNIQHVYYITQSDTLEATLYHSNDTKLLQLIRQNQRLPTDTREVRVIRTGGPKRMVLDYNPTEDTEDNEQNQLLQLWGNDWLCNLEWDPKEWLWRRIGILPETTVLNYTTKRGYRVALRQKNHKMPMDAELEVAGMDSKTRAIFFNRIWHPYLPCEVSAMQWLVLT